MELPCEECGKDCQAEPMVYDEVSGLYVCEECFDKPSTQVS